jgi:ankyrin repeat protein
MFHSTRHLNQPPLLVAAGRNAASIVLLLTIAKANIYAVDGDGHGVGYYIAAPDGGGLQVWDYIKITAQSLIANAPNATCLLQTKTFVANLKADNAGGGDLNSAALVSEKGCLASLLAPPRSIPADARNRRHGNTTALMTAAELGNVHAMHLLLDAGADVNATSDDGHRSVLAEALLLSFGEEADKVLPAVKILVDAGRWYRTLVCTLEFALRRRHHTRIQTHTYARI